MIEVGKALEEALGQAAESQKAIWKPQNEIDVDAEKAATIMKLMNALEDDDDVQNVYSNFTMSEEVIASLG
jgi:transcriptional/translational regulatory protein YebC/TACO1